MIARFTLFLVHYRLSLIFISLKQTKYSENTFLSSATNEANKLFLFEKKKKQLNSGLFMNDNRH